MDTLKTNDPLGDANKIDEFGDESLLNFVGLGGVQEQFRIVIRLFPVRMQCPNPA